MKAEHFGSCLCGNVRFEIEGDFEQFFLCHCEYCQKDTGSAHAANLFTSSGRLKWISGVDFVKEFTLPGTRHKKCFCSNCGSALPCQQGEDSSLVIPAGSLDSKVGIRPNAHIFVSSRASWDSDLEKIPSHERFPS